jgi:hypothetical protein
MTLGRRRLLVVGGSAIVGGLIGSVAGWWRGRDDEVAGSLRTFLSDFAGAASLGDLVDRGDLGDLDPAAMLASFEQGDFAAAVRAAAGDDLRAGRTVVVDGWHLSRTEAALCVLAADEAALA